MQRWLLGTAAYLIAADGTYVVTDKGLKIRLATGFEFFLPVIRGQDDVEVGGPAVVAACPRGTQSQPGSATRVVEIEVTLRYPADEGDHAKELLAAFEYAAAQLAAALMRDDFLERLSEHEEEFTALSYVGTWTEDSGWIERLRTYRYMRQIVVTPADL